MSENKNYNIYKNNNNNNNRIIKEKIKSKKQKQKGKERGKEKERGKGKKKGNKNDKNNKVRFGDEKYKHGQRKSYDESVQTRQTYPTMNIYGGSSGDGIITHGQTPGYIDDDIIVPQPYYDDLIKQEYGYQYPTQYIPKNKFGFGFCFCFILYLCCFELCCVVLYCEYLCCFFGRLNL